MEGKINSQKQKCDELSKKDTLHSREILNLQTDLQLLRADTKRDISQLQQDCTANKSDLRNTKKDIDRLTKETNSLKEERRDAHRRIIDLEYRSRRNNLLFFGIEESPDEADDKDKVKEKVLSFMVDQMKIANARTALNLTRCHRLGAPKKGTFIGRRADRPRPIIVNFVDYSQKEYVREHRKNLKAPYGVANDLPASVRSAQKTLVNQLKEIKKTEPKSAIVYPCKLISKGEVVAEVDVVDFFKL